MKSPMVTNLGAITDPGRYSDLQVLQSAAGFYIGTVYTDEHGFKEPGSRDSDYFATREEAERALGAMQALGQGVAAQMLRKTP